MRLQKCMHHMKQPRFMHAKIAAFDEYATETWSSDLIPKNGFVIDITGN